jgi:hypothetical protein
VVLENFQIFSDDIGDDEINWLLESKSSSLSSKITSDANNNSEKILWRFISLNSLDSDGIGAPSVFGCDKIIGWGVL